MNRELRKQVAGWQLTAEADPDGQIQALLEPLFAGGWLPDGHESFAAVLLGEQYHLGGAEDTRRMAEALGIVAADRVLDLACYVGGPARQLAQEHGCEVVGVDISPVHTTVAEALTRLCGLDQKVRFICASADAVPLADGSFTVAWSQCSMPANLGWMPEITRLLVPGGRLAFTGLVHRTATSDADMLSLEGMTERVRQFGYRVITAEDISQFDLEYGWLPARRKLKENEGPYRGLMGAEWVRKAYDSLDADIAQWQSGQMGNARVVAIKGGQ